MLYPVADVVAAVTRCLERHGLEPGDAIAVTNHLVEADLWGRRGHGVNARLRSICERLATRNPGPARWRIAVDKGARLSLNANGEEGYLMLVRAADLAAERAQAHACAVVAVTHTTHTGMLGYATYRIASAGYVAMGFAHCCPLVAPTGAAAKLLGTNPLSFAFPRKPEPIVVDLSTAASTCGHLRRQLASGHPLQPGCAIDERGEPTTDPSAALAGALLPLAGTKGTALATAVQLLAGAFTGAAAVPEPQQDYGLLLLAFQADALREEPGFATAVEDYVKTLAATPVAPGTSGPRLPGAGAFAHRDRALAHGLPIDPALWQDLLRP